MEQNLLPDNKKGMRKLKDDLRKVSSSIDIVFLDENDDSLSLMVDETLKGVDIRKEYPSFYHTLTKNAELRQRFYDAITLDASDLTTDQGLRRNIKLLQAALSDLDEKHIKSCRLSINDLSAIFFPQQKLAFRGASALGPRYMLFNEEIELQPVTYSVLVEGMLSETPSMFALEVDLSISDTTDNTIPALPVELEFNWGRYLQHLTISDEGLFTLPDLPLSSFLNADMAQVTAALELSLSRPH